MKLIIDIPEEIYIEKKEDYIGDTLDKAIANGTPLEEELKKIQNEIQRIADIEWNQQVGASNGLEFAIEIIDNYIPEPKGEQE